MSKLRQIYRLFHINIVLIKHGLDQMVLSIPFFAPIRFLTYFNPWRWSAQQTQPRGVRIRNALIELGPIFVKFGQVLSTRSDLLPEDIIEELSKLQDQVPPFPGSLAKVIVETELGKSIQDIFADFDLTPFASASIAQVHAAQFHNGKEVVVKVVRPGIETIIEQDVSLLLTFSKLIAHYWPPAQRLHPIEVVLEFERTIMAELDLIREAANASQLRRNFQDSPMLYIPEIYWPFARNRVLVMERIYGIPISEVETLRNNKVNLKLLAERGVEIFFTQVFRDRFFHADMHPGNIFVNPLKPYDPQYIAVDFGIIGTLSPKDQRYLAENFLAFFKRDYHRVAELHIESGWIPANTRLDEFEAAIRTVCEPIFERPLKDISFGRTLMRLFHTGRTFNMEIQPQLILLQKTLVNIEGLGRKLYPDLDLWRTARPYLENWIKQQYSPRLLWKNTVKNIPYWSEALPELPRLIQDTLTSIKDSKQADTNMKQQIMLAKISRKKLSQGILQGLGLAFLIIAIINSIALENQFVFSQFLYLTAALGVCGLILLLISVLKKS